MRELVFELKPPPKARSSSTKKNTHGNGGTDDAYEVRCTSSRCCLRQASVRTGSLSQLLTTPLYADRKRHRTRQPHHIRPRPRQNPPQSHQAPRKRPRAQQPLHVRRRNRQSNRRPHRPPSRHQSEKRPCHLPTDLGPTHWSHRRTGTQPQQHYRPDRSTLDNARPRPPPNLKPLQRTLRLHKHAPPPTLPPASPRPPPRRHGRVHYDRTRGAAVHAAGIRVGRCAGADGRRTCILHRADASGQDARRDGAGPGTELWLV
jgi:hypothetical protein